MKYLFCFLLVFPTLLLSKEQLDEQRSKQISWLNISVGKSNLGTVGAINFNIPFGDHYLFNAGYVGTDDDGGILSEPEKSVNTFHTAFGFQTMHPKEFFGFDAGICLVHGFRQEYLGSGYNSNPFSFRKGAYEKHKFKTWGVMIHAQFHVRLAKSLGLGAEFFGCPNPEIPFAAILLGMQFGP